MHLTLMITLYLLAAWAGLFVVCFVFAAIAHSFPSLGSTYAVVHMIHRLLGYLFVPAILIDLVRWIF